MALHVDNQFEIPEAEVAQYVRRAEDMIAAGELPADTCRMAIEPDTYTGEDVVIRYYRRGAPHFERIRRITGYLVGTLDRFNDAKRAEERDRVKHGLTTAPQPEHDPEEEVADHIRRGRTSHATD